MDELIELLIRGIAGWLSSKPTPPPARPGGLPAPSRYPAPASSQYAPPPITAADRLRAMTAPGARRTAPPPIGGARRRRPVSMPPVMMADPILTEVAADPVRTAPVVTKLKPLAKSVTAVKSSARAATIRGWLTPGSLKKQYILTELLQQPVSMREAR